MKKALFNLSSETFDALDDFSKRFGFSKSEVARLAIATYLNRHVDPRGGNPYAYNGRWVRESASLVAVDRAQMKNFPIH